jgi:2-iminobutanoate/2-iminopropanoate deaminase
MQTFVRWISLPVLSLAAACTAAEIVPTRHHSAEGALGPYSSAVEAGELVFVSGKIGQQGGSFEEEAETAIDRVEQQLNELGLGLGDIVSATVYLSDMDLYSRINAVYGKRLPAPYPARACIAVKTLPRNARVEIQVIARRQR